MIRCSYRLPVSLLLAALALCDGLLSAQSRFLGCTHSAPQNQEFTTYWDQVTPENGGKWGSVERTRDIMNWTALDNAYNLAKQNGFPFRFHVLVWGNQQPSWIESLPPAEQLEEIEEWFAAVAARYPDIDYLEVVNEPLHDPPSQAGSGGGNYIAALGGSGVTGWDWVVEAFRMARLHFPDAQLMINDYSIVNSASSTSQYLSIIALLQAENLIDVIGVQGHAFSTTGPTATIEANLASLAATGLPIQVTELDIDGPDDATQLADYQRIFPLFWEHPSVIGVTLWGFRPGMWRTAQRAYLVESDGTERPAMVWLQDYVAGTESPLSFASYCALLGLGADDHSLSRDLDHDALGAGLEYLTGTDPNAANVSPMQWTFGPADVALTIPVSSLVGEGTLVVESSRDLEHWSPEGSYNWPASTGTNLILTGTGAARRVEFSKPVSGSQSQEFFRIGFSIP